MTDFEIENGILKKYHGNGGTVIIPDDVVKIGEKAFKDCTDLTNITLPEKITSIGRYAFEGCKNLTNIIIPKNVTKIESFTFRKCTGLTNITIPENIISIGEYAFAYCESLTNITIPEKTTSIGRYAFTTCIGLTNIIIPNNVTQIKPYTFIKCANLVSISLPENLISIGKSAFSGCKSLTSLTLPDSVISIGDSAFAHCGEFKLIYYGCSVLLDSALLYSFSFLSKYSSSALTLEQLYHTNLEKILCMIRENDFSVELPAPLKIRIIAGIIESGEFIDKNNIDYLIQYAIEQQAHEVLLMLMDYKEKKIGYDDIETTIKNKFTL